MGFSETIVIIEKFSTFVPGLYSSFRYNLLITLIIFK